MIARSPVNGRVRLSRIWLTKTALPRGKMKISPAGSFLIFLFVRFFGFDFLHASAAAKIVNVATNLAAIAYFAPNGYYLPVLAVVMAIGNIGGSFLGTHLALRHGSGFVRKVFLIVVSALIVKFAWDTF